METIRDLFVKYGELGRIILPPTGITGKFVNNQVLDNKLIMKFFSSSC